MSPQCDVTCLALSKHVLIVYAISTADQEMHVSLTPHTFFARKVRTKHDPSVVDPARAIEVNYSVYKLVGEEQQKAISEIHL